GLYNLIRQLGGSFGTAVFATMLENMQQSNRALLIRHINAFHPAFSQWLEGLKQIFIARGSDPWTAQSQAMRALEGMVMRQASVLSFERFFFMIGALFSACLPLVFSLKPARRSGHADPIEA